MIMSIIEFFEDLAHSEFRTRGVTSKKYGWN